MKILKSTFLFSAILTLVLFTSSCKTESINPQKPVDGTGTHIVNAQLAGKWLWTQSSDGGVYNNDGVYTGAANGLARQYMINADGTGSCYDHLYSSLDGSSGFEINISSTGFFESDGDGHLGYFPLSGTYKTSNGTNRALSGNELYDIKTKTGRRVIMQKLVVTTQGGRSCFQVTSSDNITDIYFKIQ